MPFLNPPPSSSGGDTYLINPAIIGQGPPSAGTTEDSGRLYIDSVTNLVWANVEGTWKPLAQKGDPGPPGEPRWWGHGAPPENVPAAADGGPSPGEMYLDLLTGDVYQMNRPSGQTTDYGQRWTS